MATDLRIDIAAADALRERASDDELKRIHVAQARIRRDAQKRADERAQITLEREQQAEREREEQTRFERDAAPELRTGLYNNLF